MASVWPRQGSAAIRRLNKKINDELLEISVNFVAEKGVTYTNARGAVTSKGDVYRTVVNHAIH
jgi:hypothetical protein